MTSKRKFVREITAIIKAKKQPENKTAEYIVDKVLEWKNPKHTHTSDEIMEMTNRAVMLCESRGFQLLPYNITASLIELGFAEKIQYTHFQDPCIFCGQKMSDVEIGECPAITQTNTACTGQEPA